MAKKDDGFTQRLISALIPEIEDRSWKDVELLVATLAKEHGVPKPAPLAAKLSRAFAAQEA